MVPRCGRRRLHPRAPIRTSADRPRCRGGNRRRRRPCLLRPPRSAGPRLRPDRGSRPQPAGNAARPAWPRQLTGRRRSPQHGSPGPDSRRKRHHHPQTSRRRPRAPCPDPSRAQRRPTCSRSPTPAWHGASRTRTHPPHRTTPLALSRRPGRCPLAFPTKTRDCRRRVKPGQRRRLERLRADPMPTDSRADRTVEGPPRHSRQEPESRPLWQMTCSAHCCPRPA